MSNDYAPIPDADLETAFMELLAEVRKHSTSGSAAEHAAKEALLEMTRQSTSVIKAEATLEEIKKAVNEHRIELYVIKEKLFHEYFIIHQKIDFLLSLLSLQGSIHQNNAHQQTDRPTVKPVWPED